MPTLHAGDLVVMDNLAAHKVEGVRERIEATSARLWYLPPYSPDFNPIELWFAKLKALLRAARRRSVDELWTTVGDCLRSSAPPNVETTSVTAATQPLHAHEKRASRGHS